MSSLSPSGRLGVGAVGICPEGSWGGGCADRFRIKKSGAFQELPPPE